MKLSRALLSSLSLLLVPAVTAACGGGDSTSGDTSSTSTGGNGGNGGSTGGTTGGAGGSVGGSTGGTTTGGTGGSTGGTGGTTTTTTTTTSMMAVADPTQDGPYTTVKLDDTITSNNKQVPIHAVYPVSGPEAGPYPVIVIAHGFQLPASQYYKYADRLATFGYVALTVDYPNGFTADNPQYAAALSAGLDWSKTKLPNAANPDLAGATGHSLGGKVSILAATLDARIKASIVLDPVDGGGGPGGGCNPPGCVDVSALMPNLHIPTGFLGETTDAMGGFQPCAPAAENFQTFYADANSPSFAVTIKGANHMSFLDDVASCGFLCSFCNMASLDNATVNNMSRGYVVAFYERHLRNNAGYDTWLTGQKAQDLYVTPGTATIESK